MIDFPKILNQSKPLTGSSLGTLVFQIYGKEMAKEHAVYRQN